MLLPEPSVAPASSIRTRFARSEGSEHNVAVVDRLTAFRRPGEQLSDVVCG